MNGSCEIHAFEPEARNFAKLKTWITEAHVSQGVQAIEAGLWEKSGSLPLQVSQDQEFSGSHRVATCGGTEVQVIALDDYVEEKGISPSFIKLDIEGSELEALRGAEKTIRRCRPRLAVCLYHKPRDLWEIPLWLEELGLGYSFFLGHHDPAPTETVLYGICP